VGLCTVAGIDSVCVKVEGALSDFTVAGVSADIKVQC
jgi:hypothetical protein